MKIKFALTLILAILSLAALAQTEQPKDTTSTEQGPITGVDEDGPITGIEDGIFAEVKIYPNPFTTSLKIETPATIKYITLDSRGNEVDINSAAPGLYYVTLNTPQDKYTVKVMKL